MRDRRFVAAHRGGPLDITHHLLAAWAADCAERVLSLFEEHSPDDRPRRAIARAWARGEVPVGDAMKAALAAGKSGKARAHRFASEYRSGPPATPAAGQRRGVARKMGVSRG